jgi:DNA gyrase/topoisomerase IV subunit B
LKSKIKLVKMIEYDKLEVLGFEDALKSKTMYMGSDTLEEFTTYLFRDGRLTASKINISFRLWKIIDEIIVNAADRFVMTSHYGVKEGGPTTSIHIHYNEDTGEVSVSNNGQGFPVIPAQYLEKNKKGFTKAMAGRWMPEILCTAQHAGSNHVIHPDKVTGGINGIGIKGVIANCKTVKLETVDVLQYRYYEQTFKGITNVTKPTVIEYDESPNRVELPDDVELSEQPITVEQRMPHTSFTFLPDFANLCREEAGKSNPNWFNKKNSKILGEIIQARAFHLSGYLCSLIYRHEDNGKDIRYDYKHIPTVYYNNGQVPIRTFEQYASMYDGVESGHLLKFQDGDIRFPWQVYLGIRKEPSKPSAVSLIDGIFLPEGGTHITVLQTQLLNALTPFICKALKIKDPKDLTDNRKNEVLKLITFIHSGFLPVADFEGQVKNKVKINRKTESWIRNTYIIPEETAKILWKKIGPKYLEMVLEKDAVDKAKQKVKTPVVRIRKYEPAELAITHPDGRHGDQLYLACPEGDSAKLALDAILSRENCMLTRKNTGTVNTQGVPPNILKNSKVIKDGDIHVLQLNKMIENNITFKSILTSCGLRDDYHYFYKPLDPAKQDPKSWTEEEKLKYEKLRHEGDIQFRSIMYRKGIFMFTDQDVDGGQISALVILYIMHKWPGLAQRGFCHIIETPLIRAYPKSAKESVLEFLNERDFERWLRNKYNGDNDLARRNYSFSYYKGLSQHSKEELEDIADNIKSYIRTISYDPKCREVYEIMYGKETAARKQELMNPIIKDLETEHLKTSIIPFSLQMEISVKLFQLDFFQRKLPSPLDGFIPVKRKAFATLRRHRNAGKIRVFQITGSAAKEMYYAHGEASMNGAITKMAQSHEGTNIIPPFLAVSIGFGNRRHGRDVTGQPRYIDLMYNKVMDIIYPLEDDLLLPLVEEEGYEAEPRYYIPVLPMAILETHTTVAAGWNIQSWARDFNAVVMNIRHMIRNNYPSKAGQPTTLWGKPWLYKDQKCTLQHDKNGAEIITGKYTYDEKKNMVQITQLPPKFWSFEYSCKILGLEDKPSPTKKPAAKVKAATLKRGKTQEGEEVKGKEYVAQVFDNTSNEKVDLRIFLRPDSMEKINAEYGTEHLDSIEHYLGLYQRSTTANLNFVTPEGVIKEFDKFEDILCYWFDHRKKLYVTRLEYQRILLKLRVLYYENMLRYITESNAKIIDISKKKDDIRYAILSQNKYVKFDTARLFERLRAQPNEIENIVLGETATYKYIDNIREWQRGEEGIIDLTNDLEKARKALEDAMKLTWQDVWNGEIDAAVSAVEEGMAKQWSVAKRKYKRETVRVDDEL